MIGLFIIHPARAARAARGSRLRPHAAGLGAPSEQHHPEHAGDGVQLADDERQGRAGDDAAGRQAGRARPHTHRQPVMDHHPMHLHGHTFYVTGTRPAASARPPQPGNTVLVGVAQARDVEFVATHDGDWMLHCHLPHHMMNQMVSMVGPMMTSHRPTRQQPRRRCRSGPSNRCPNAGMFPGYPQDMAMMMDEAVEKPETFGLRKGWTAGMMGMMTLIRVVSPALFEQIAERGARRRGGPYEGAVDASADCWLPARPRRRRRPGTRWPISNASPWSRIPRCRWRPRRPRAPQATPSRPARG